MGLVAACHYVNFTLNYYYYDYNNYELDRTHEQHIIQQNSICCAPSIQLVTVCVDLIMATGGSCEQNRTKAYSEDLRWRMIYHVCALGKSHSETASCLGVDPSTVRRTVALFDETGSVTKRKYPDTHGDHLRKLTDVDKLLVLEIAL